MIRNISRRLKQRVDVVVSDEYEGTLFLMHHPQFVNAVYGLRPAIVARRYETVFLTHSFGGARMPFAAGRTVWSRDRDHFRAGAVHETLFNLDAARDLLGIPYDPDNAVGYFVGDLSYTRPDEPLIGIHAGSKAGKWTSKRWPHFVDLAKRLMRAGHRVASFGTPDEYVEGTENHTGGTIAEMSRDMLNCSFFIANDSGVMNIANALGIPLLAIFAPTDVRTRLPLRATSAAIVLQKDCAPCEVKNPPLFGAGQCRCIGEISVAAVEAKVHERMADTKERVTYVG
jgi:hypothetical protein